MSKLLRLLALPSVATWAWWKRSEITDKVKVLAGRPDPADTKTGYGEVVDRDGLITPPEFERATTE